MASQMRNWFLHLSPREIDGLLQKLLDYDKKRRVNYEEGLASKVESDMILMMNQLGQLIEKEDSLFRGSMMQCGSSYNRTKSTTDNERRSFGFYFLNTGRLRGKTTAKNLSSAIKVNVKVETSRDTNGTELLILHSRRPNVPPMGHSKPTNTMDIILGMLQTVMSKSAKQRLTIR